MRKKDELLGRLQIGITNLYKHVDRAKECCSEETATLQELVAKNGAWLKLEDAIADLENLAHKVVKQSESDGR